MKVSAPMSQLLEDDDITPDNSAHQPVPRKRKRPGKEAQAAPKSAQKAPHGEVVQPKTVDPRNALNDLTSTEWLPETVSVWNQRGLGANHPDAQIERQHPAPFSFTDVSRLVRFFTKKNEVVLDPFVGVGSTLKACAVEGRNGIGFELNSRYAELARERLRVEVRDMFASLLSQDIRVGDARTLIKDLPDDSVDLVVTSPPYWNILHKEDHKAKQERKDHDLDTRYGDDERDLGNIHDYQSFLEELAAILGACGRALKSKKHMAVIVSDFRDKSRFVMFHADLARALEKYKLELRGLTVLYQRHKRIFPYGYPYAYVPNIHHQYILILQNVKKA
jgi:DNA modification methylase